MKKYLGLPIVLFFILVMSFAINANGARAEDDADNNKGAICTMDAKLCPDGTYVSRTGPKCEFAECPDGRKMKSEGDDDKSDNESLRDEARKKMEGLRVKIKEEKDIAKAKIKEARLSVRETALVRFDAAVERINSLVNRVNAQITKFEAKGVDVSKSKSSVAIAAAKLNDARAKIIEINALLSISIDELSKENRTKLVALARDAQGLIVESHLALIDAIKSLRDAVKIKMEVKNNQ